MRFDLGKGRGRVLVEHRFRVRLRCGQCLGDSLREIGMYERHGRPASVNRLLQSGALEQLAYRCRRCGSESASVIAASAIRPDGARAGSR